MPSRSLHLAATAGLGGLVLLGLAGAAAAQTLDKSVLPATVAPGGRATFTLVVDNPGPGALTDCRLIDSVPGCVVLDTASCTATPPIPLDCGVVSAGSVNTLSSPFTVPGGGRQTITFAVTAGTTPGACLNHAEVFCAEGALQDDATLSIAGAALAVTKSASPPAVPAGGTSTYTVTIDNRSGTLPLTGCTLTDDVAASGCMSLAPGSCGSSPALAVECGVVPDRVAVTTPFSVAAGALQTVTFDVVAGAAAGACQNAVDVACDAQSTRATGSLLVGSAATLTKQVAPASVGRGQPATFTLTLDNRAGATPLTGCRLFDPVSTSCMALDTSSCTAAPPVPLDCGVATPDVVNTSATPFAVPAGAAQSFSFRVTGGGSPADCFNQAEVFCDQGAFRDDATLAVTAPLLALTKEASPSSVPPGGRGSYTVTIDNQAGTAPLAGCTLSDQVDATACMTLVASSCGSSPPLSVDCGVSLPNRVAVTTPFSVPAGAVQRVTFEVDAGASAGLCDNLVQVQCGPDADQATGTLRISSDAPLAKRVAPSPVGWGGRATFTVELDNRGGASALTGCVLEDPIDASCMALDTASCASSPAVTLDCGVTLPGMVNSFFSPFTVAAGVVQRITFDVVAGPATAACPNSARVSCDGGYQAEASATLDVLGPEVRKSVDPPAIAVGDPATFTLVVDNSRGAGALTNCRLLDTVDVCATLDTASCVATPAIPLDCGVVMPRDVNTLAAPFTVPAGAVQEIRFRVAGAFAGPCSNQVDVQCDSGVSERATAVLAVGAVGCAVAAVDQLGGVPPLAAAYVNVCAPGDVRLDDALLVGTAPVGVPTDLDLVAGAAGALRLYQLDCGCANDIALVKNPATARVQAHVR